MTRKQKIIKHYSKHLASHFNSIFVLYSALSNIYKHHNGVGSRGWLVPCTVTKVIANQ
uniref:Uncharacterized protein n=1 Tax=Anguilla anguilla TaxID=7936 RepID=A0A0E9WKM0_ANGAN